MYDVWIWLYDNTWTPYFFWVFKMLLLKQTKI